MSGVGGPRVVDVVILDENEAKVAAISVRMYLADLRGKYRRDVARGQNDYAARCVEKFDSALELYERLGGDPDEVLDIWREAGPGRAPADQPREGANQ